MKRKTCCKEKNILGLLFFNPPHAKIHLGREVFLETLAQNLERLICINRLIHHKGGEKKRKRKKKKKGALFLSKINQFSFLLSHKLLLCVTVQLATPLSK